jgi:copper transport protein
MLFAFLLRQANARELTAILPVWSGWALFAITVLVLAGTAQALVEIGTIKALTGTTYGQLVLVKVGLLAIVLCVAAYSRQLTNRHFTPPVAEEPAGVDADIDDPSGDFGDDPDAEPDRPVAGDWARRRLRIGVMIEVGIAVVVLAVTSVLVQSTPARSADAAANAPDQPFTSTVSTKLFKLEVDVSPAKVGANSVHLFALKTDGSGPQTIVEWQATAGLPAKGIEPIVLPVLAITPDHAVGEVTLVAPGTWELRFTLRVDDINQATVTVKVPIRS